MWTSCGSAAQRSHMATATILDSIAQGNREPLGAFESSGALTGDVIQEDSSGNGVERSAGERVAGNIGYSS